MGKGRKHLLNRLLLGIAIAGGLTALTKTNLLLRGDQSVSDLWYQSRQVLDGEIVIAGIDPYALEELGPYEQWGRSIVAEAICRLNQSEGCRPAVIALDVLYAGETEPDLDASLVAAAEEYGNVVVGCAGKFADTFAEDGAAAYFTERFHIQGFEEPFEALREAAATGHINAMLDTDGILRHHLLGFRLPDGREIPSMALVTAERFQAFHGLEPVTLPPTDGNGFWYVPFYGEQGDFYEDISIADILSGKVPASYFAGKIVLIGPYAPGLRDSYVTAVDHGQPMYGVEYQANAIQALLCGRYKQEADDSLQRAMLFFLLLLGWLCFWKKSAHFSTAVWFLLCGGWLLLCRFAYAHGWVLHVLWVPLGLTVQYIGALAMNYLQAARQRREITNTFRRYVAPEIVSELLKEKNTLELGGKQVNIAVLFVDVRGFTTMSEQLDPGDVVEILNRYLSLVSDCIFSHHGTLDKFVGDAAMAFWGAPLPQEDYVMNAVLAAVDMKEGSQALSEELMDKYGQTVSFGIGIHVGEAVVGNIGSSRRMDYTAIGDTVNTAARLEANAPGGTIYISSEVADVLKGRIRCTSLGNSVKLKGKKEGVEVLVLDEILHR